MFAMITKWFNNIMRAIYSIIARIWQAAQEATLGAWNGYSLNIKLAASLLVAIISMTIVTIFWGVPVGGFFFSTGALVATLATGLTGLHMVALFVYRLVKPVEAVHAPVNGEFPGEENVVQETPVRTTNDRRRGKPGPQGAVANEAFAA